MAGRIRAGVTKLGTVAFQRTAQAFREVVTTAMDKGAVSRAVTDRIRAELSYDCGPCAARHVSGSLF
ncbi:hypothetical protein [Micromonospora sp. L31]|uniref:hypothetical protein n=1 Tax=Micromonospora sp. L31 TaxID=3452213 RepID=UPI003F8B8CC0